MMLDVAQWMHSRPRRNKYHQSSILRYRCDACLPQSHVGLNKHEAKDLVDAFFDEISDSLGRGEAVKLSGFGNFQLRDKVSRRGRNPKTGVKVNIPARRVVTVHASQKLIIVADDSGSPGILGRPEHVDANDRN